MTVRSIPLDLIDIVPGHNLRESGFTTEDLEESMSTLGQLQAIQVVARGDRFLLNAGERRFTAARRLGWAEINALILEGLDDVDVELASIDENIIRRDLQGSSLDRALARRKELYIRKYPNTTQYAAGGHARAAGEEGEKHKSFAEDTAEKTGKSARTIERSVRRAERLSPETMSAYDAGRINQTQADILSALPHEEQRALISQVEGLSVEDTRRLVGGDFKKGDAKKDDKARRPMQLLEELYMHGQKIVACLERLAEFDELHEELVESVLQLRDTLNDDFDTFASRVEGKIAARVDLQYEPDPAAAPPGDAAAADPLDDFPDDPPF